MKIILFLEQRFFIDNKKIYAEKVVNEEYINRYTRIFDEVVICAREVKQLPSSFIQKPIINRQISFLALPNVNSTNIIKNRRRIKQQIKNELNTADGFIIRAPSSISYIAYYCIKDMHKPIATELVADARVFFTINKSDFFLKNLLKHLLQNMAVGHERKLAWNSNAVLYVTKKYLQNLYPCKALKVDQKDSKSIYVSCSDVILKPEFYNSHFSKYDGKERFVICHTGSLSGENKGQRTVIEILERLMQNGFNCEVHFIGDGDNRVTFEQLAKDKKLENRIFFHGQISNFNEIKNIYSKAHLFLFPSISEGLPRALIEAMANSLPCLAYDVGGINELLPVQCLSKLNDKEGLYSKTEKMITNQKYREAQAIRNYFTSKDYEIINLNSIRDEFYKQFKKMCENKI